MEVKSKTSVWATGFAMFSMFFGAGNVVFPLQLGLDTQSQNFWAIAGLLITAVGVPFIGLIAMTLFNGNYRHFFERIGKVPGFVVAAMIMALIGPFGALPRLITLSHATFSIYFEGISLITFSALSCVVIYLLTFKKNKILDILGYWLTPFLLISLFIIVMIGLFMSPASPASALSRPEAFFHGLETGYQTMDLLGAFFFSSVVISCLEVGEVAKGHTKNFRNVIFMTLKASCIGAALLALVYIGFSYTAAFNSEALATFPSEALLGKVAMHMLGPYAGIVAILAVSLACLTTAIALVAVFSEFLEKEILQEKLGYIPCLIFTIIVTFFFSLFSFSGVMKFVAPILQYCYPALIVLCIVNIGHKLNHFNAVKIPVLITFILTIALQWL